VARRSAARHAETRARDPIDTGRAPAAPLRQGRGRRGCGERSVEFVSLTEAPRGTGRCAPGTRPGKRRTSVVSCAVDRAARGVDPQVLARAEIAGHSALLLASLAAGLAAAALRPGEGDAPPPAAVTAQPQDGCRCRRAATRSPGSPRRSRDARAPRVVARARRRCRRGREPRRDPARIAARGARDSAAQEANAAESRRRSGPRPEETERLSRLART